jgi:hypothetical protein
MPAEKRAKRWARPIRRSSTSRPGLGHTGCFVWLATDKELQQTFVELLNCRGELVAAVAEDVERRPGPDGNPETREEREHRLHSDPLPIARETADHRRGDIHAGARREHGDDARFDIGELGPVADGDWPGMVTSRALTLLPKEIKARFGKDVDTAFNGDYLEIPLAAEGELVAALRERGFEVTRDDDLINTLGGRTFNPWLTDGVARYQRSWPTSNRLDDPPGQTSPWKELSPSDPVAGAYPLPAAG